MSADESQQTIFESLPDRSPTTLYNPTTFLSVPNMGSGEDNTVHTEIFAGVLKDAKVVSVDPAACIPFIKVRDVVPSGVKRLKHSYASSDAGCVARGAVTGGHLPTVVELGRPLRHYVMDYFMEHEGLGEGEALEKYKSREEWYGIVDGCHRLQALLELRAESPKYWAGFSWCVLLLAPGLQIGLMRAFARDQNLRRKEEVFVETTLFDILAELQSEQRNLAAKNGGRQPSPRELAESYSRCQDRTSNAMRHYAALSLKLSESVISTIGDITNLESPHLACTYYSLKGRTGLTPDVIEEVADCRVYRNFLTVTALRNASNFLNSIAEDADTARICTLHRAKEVCRGTGFRSVTTRVLKEQFAKSLAALKECRKFEKLLQSSTWPRGMESVRQNLLWNTIMDSEVESNEGNDRDVLPSLMRHLRRVCPQRVSMMEAKYLASEMEAAEENQDEAPAQDPDKDEEKKKSATAVLTEEIAGVGVCKAERAEKEEDCSKKAQEGDRNLQQLGISCYNLTWQDYNTSFNSTTEGMFDLIITEPPRSMSSGNARGLSYAESALTEGEMKAFVTFAKRVVTPGGYLIIFTPASLFMEWVRLLRMHEIGCVDYPFVVLYNTKGLQRTNQLLFPQPVCDMAVMGVCPGKHPRGFKPNFKEEYCTVGCSMKRKFAAIDQAPIARRKLRHEGSRAYVRTEEKSSDVLTELLKTFSPDDGHVLDPYGGTMPIASACMTTGRQCTVIEADEKCFSLAVKRLRSLSTLHIGTPLDRMRAKTRLLPELTTNYSDSGSSDGGDSVEMQREDDASLDHEEVNSSTLSISSTPSSPLPDLMTQESVIVEPSKETVMLVYNGEVVGGAEVQKVDGGPQRVLHGFPLSNYASAGEDLVVVYRVNIRKECQKYRYPYKYGGVEDPIKLLGEMQGGFYAWDMHATVATHKYA